MSFLHPKQVLPGARRSLEAQAARLRGWAAKASEKDSAKIGERANELRDLAQMVDYIEQLETALARVGEDAYHEGYYKGFHRAKQAYDQTDTVKALSRLLFKREYAA